MLTPFQDVNRKGVSDLSTHTLKVAPSLAAFGVLCVINEEKHVRKNISKSQQHSFNL